MAENTRGLCGNRRDRFTIPVEHPTLAPCSPISKSSTIVPHILES